MNKLDILPIVHIIKIKKESDVRERNKKSMAGIPIDIGFDAFMYRQRQLSLSEVTQLYYT